LKYAPSAKPIFKWNSSTTSVFCTKFSLYFTCRHSRDYSFASRSSSPAYTVTIAWTACLMQINVRIFCACGRWLCSFTRRRNGRYTSFSNKRTSAIVDSLPILSWRQNVGRSWQKKSSHYLPFLQWHSGLLNSALWSLLIHHVKLDICNLWPTISCKISRHW
jgi:hypothetical protein